MAIEFFSKENRPQLVSTDFVMYRFVPVSRGEGKDAELAVRLDYVIEGALNDWTPLFTFTVEDYLLMSCNKFIHAGVEGLGVIASNDPASAKERSTESMTWMGEKEESHEN